MFLLGTMLGKDCSEPGTMLGLQLVWSSRSPTLRLGLIPSEKASRASIGRYVHPSAQARACLIAIMVSRVSPVLARATGPTE